MTKPISDKAEVALEYPDKLYIGTFERSARFDAHLDQTGISLALYRTGDSDVRKSVRIHLHYGLFADILHDLANTASSMSPDDAAHRESLRAAAEALCRSLGGEVTNAKGSLGANKTPAPEGDDVSQLTPHDEVLLLHVME
jgi:hypothetical protein